MFRKLISRISTLESPPPWTVLAAISSVIASFAAVIFGTAIATIMLQNLMQFTTLLGWTVGAVITIAYVFIRFRRPEERAALRLGETPASKDRSAALSLQQIFLMLLIGVGLSVALDVVSGRVTNTFLPDPELLGLYLDNLRGIPVRPISWILAVIFMVIAQPIAEEIIFRGVLLPGLRKAVGAWPGYILSALIYALFHLLAYSNSITDFNSLWYGLALPFIAALIFGAVRLYTGSTRAAILAHVGFGLFALVKIVTLVG